MSGEDASVESGNKVDAPRDRVEIEMVITEVEAETAGGEAVAGREANISGKDSEARTGGSVEARAKVTHTSARVQETRSSGAVDVPENDVCTPT